MLDNEGSLVPSHDSDSQRSFVEYLDHAARACDAGDEMLGLHLYLAAFEQSLTDTDKSPDEAALSGLKRAWQLACSLKQRTIAEYVYERLEPYLSADEQLACAEQLQQLAFDKLEEIGMSRQDLEDMAQAISQECNSLMPSGFVGLIGKAGEAGLAQNIVESKPEVKRDTRENDTDEHLDYQNLVGFESTIALMRDFGVGMQSDEEFLRFVRKLNKLHGIDRMPACDALLFRSPAREDASRFMMATLGEIALPSIRMRMEQNLQGFPVLCVMTQADMRPILNKGSNSFDGPAVLVLEDLDLWIAPSFIQDASEMGGFLMASLSRGAREAMALIQVAVEDPDVFVLASASDSMEIDPFFYGLLEPLSIIDIDYPNEKERLAIWLSLMEEHPSMNGLDAYSLSVFTKGMPRYDIYMAAREALEEAYKLSLMKKTYIPITPQNIYEKIICYQNLDSEEYRALEEAIVSDFRHDLEHMDDLDDAGNFHLDGEN